MTEIQEFDKKVHDARDAKVKEHLTQYAPVWIINEFLVPEDSSVIFHVMFQHHLYGWVERRYKYDGFNNTLYHKGQTLIDEDDALDIIDEQEPYIEGAVSDTPNSYGG